MNNPISFRKPMQVDKSVHPTVKQALQDHDQSIVDLNQANASVVSQLQVLQAHVASLMSQK
jgi:hypothetical protein